MAHLTCPIGSPPLPQCGTTRDCHLRLGIGLARIKVSISDLEPARPLVDGAQRLKPRARIKKSNSHYQNQLQYLNYIAMHMHFSCVYVMYSCAGTASATRRARGSGDGGVSSTSRAHGNKKDQKNENHNTCLAVRDSERAAQSAVLSRPSRPRLRCSRPAVAPLSMLGMVLGGCSARSMAVGKSRASSTSQPLRAGAGGCQSTWSAGCAPLLATGLGAGAVEKAA